MESGSGGFGSQPQKRFKVEKRRTVGAGGHHDEVPGASKNMMIIGGADRSSHSKDVLDSHQAGKSSRNPSRHRNESASLSQLVHVGEVFQQHQQQSSTSNTRAKSRQNTASASQS